jgi:hypothetical protein
MFFSFSFIVLVLWEFSLLDSSLYLVGMSSPAFTFAFPEVRAFDFSFPVVDGDQGSGEGESENEAEVDESCKISFDFGIDQLLSLDGQKVSEPAAPFRQPFLFRVGDEMARNKKEEEESSGSADEEDLNFGRTFHLDMEEVQGPTETNWLESAEVVKQNKKKSFVFEDLEQKKSEYVWSKVANANDVYMHLKAGPDVYLREEKAVAISKAVEECKFLNRRFLCLRWPGFWEKSDADEGFIGYASGDSMESHAFFFLDRRSKVCRSL